MPNLIISYGSTGSRQHQLKDIYLSFLRQKKYMNLSNIVVIDIDEHIQLDKEYIEQSIKVLCTFFEECLVNRYSENSVSTYLETLLGQWKNDDEKCTANDLAKRLERVYHDRLKNNEQKLLDALLVAVSKEQDIFMSSIGNQHEVLPGISMFARSHLTNSQYSVSVFLDTVQHVDRFKMSFKSNVLKCYSCLQQCFSKLKGKQYEDAMTCVNKIDHFIPPRLPRKGEFESIQRVVADAMPLLKNCILVDTTNEPLLVEVNDVGIRNFVQKLSLTNELKAALFRGARVKTNESEAVKQQKFTASAQRHLINSKIDGIQMVVWLQKGDCDIFIIGEKHSDHTNKECDGIKQAIDKVIAGCPDLDLILEVVPYDIEDQRLKNDEYESPNNQLGLAYAHYADCMKQKNCSFRVHWADPTLYSPNKNRRIPMWLEVFYKKKSEDEPYQSSTGALFDETDIQRLFTDNTLLQHEISKTTETGKPINELFTRERLLQTFTQINNLLFNGTSIADRLVNIFSKVLRPASAEDTVLLASMDQIVTNFQNWSADNKEQMSKNMQIQFNQPPYRIEMLYLQWNRISAGEKVRKGNQQSIREQLMQDFAMFADLFPHIDLLLKSFPYWTSSNEDVKREELTELIKKNGYSDKQNFLNKKIDMIYQKWNTDYYALSMQKQDRFFAMNRSLMDFYAAARVTKLKMKRVIYYAGAAHLEYFLLIMHNSGFTVKEFQKGKCNYSRNITLPFYTDKGDHFELRI